jgi:hypothetical protein
MLKGFPVTVNFELGHERKSEGKEEGVIRNGRRVVMIEGEKYEHREKKGGKWKTAGRSVLLPGFLCEPIK